MTTVAYRTSSPLTDELGRRLWSREEFVRMLELGIFDEDDRLELLAGVIFRAMTMSGPHLVALYKTSKAVTALFEPEYLVLNQMPLSLGEDSYPEPDLTVVAGSIEQFQASPPTSAVLVVEVSDTSLAKDRQLKTALYARAGIPEYWIVNLTDRVLEVYREPKPVPSDPLGHGYGSVHRLLEGEAVSPLLRRSSQVLVRDLLPETSA